MERLSSASADILTDEKLSEKSPEQLCHTELSLQMMPPAVQLMVFCMDTTMRNLGKKRST